MEMKEKIRKAMKEAGLTQQGLADMLGVKNPLINNWCTGKRNPSIKTLKKIAEATGKQLSFFVEDNSANQTAGRDNNGTMTQNIGTDSAAEISRLADKMEILSLKMDKILSALEKLIGGR